jgi:hypothetical protein
MSDLTKEYFEQQISKLATKELLEAQTKELKAHAEALQSELARMVADGFEDVQRRLDVRDLIDAHDRKFQKLEEALHIKL